MDFLGILSLCLSILGIYGLVLYLRFLLPRNVVPYVAARLSEALEILDRAESIGAIPQASEYRTTLAMYEAVVTACLFVPKLTINHTHRLYRPTSSFDNQFLQMRTESHRSPGISQQLLLAVGCGLTYRLYVLSLRIEATRVEIEVRSHGVHCLSHH